MLRLLVRAILSLLARYFANVTPAPHLYKSVNGLLELNLETGNHALEVGSRQAYGGAIAKPVELSELFEFGFHSGSLWGKQSITDTFLITKI